MEEIEGTTMDVDGDGASINTIIMEQSQMSSNEQTEKVNLSELPKELLEQILIHLDDKQLLIASHVCRSFAVAAEMAFAQKYTVNEYIISKSDGNDKNKSFHKVMLAKYGAKIRSMHMSYQDDELLALTEKKCCNLNGVEFYNISKMPKLKGLKEITLLRLKNLNRSTFTDLITNSPQLELLHIDGIENGLLGLLNGRLNTLKSLTLRNVHLVTELPKLNLESLEILNINVMDTSSCTHLLRAMNCNPIKELNMECLRESGEDEDLIINEICTIKTLVTLRLHRCPFPMTENQLQKLADQLPHLTEFGIIINEAWHLSSLEIKIQSVVSILPGLTKLTIKLNEYDYRKLFHQLKSSIYDFHECFAETNIEIEIIHYRSKVSTSKDRIFVCNADFDHVDSIELHWMNNLNERNVRKVIDGFWNYILEFKFVNKCADQSFDIATFMHSNFELTLCLDVKSNGPITVNGNATRHPRFFPSLKTLKIHLENHSAVDFLQKLDKNFCKQIGELWLHTKSIPRYQQTVEQGTDITSALAKFEKLKFVQMNPSPALNSEHLFSVCRNLEDLQIRRKW